MSQVSKRGRFVPLVALVCWVVPVMVLAGWALDLRAFKSVMPGLVAMNPLSAILFGASGLALWMIRSNSRSVGLGISLAILVLAAFRLTVYAIGGAWSPDQLLFASKLALEAPPNRMAPNSAFGFLVVATALVLLFRSQKRTPIVVSQVLGFAVGMMGLMTVVGYAANDLRFVSVFGQIPMALHSGAFFGLLGFGVALARTDVGPASIFTGPSESAVAARKLLIASVAIVAVSSLLRIWGQHAGLYGSDFGSGAFAMATILCFAIVIGLGARRQTTSDLARTAAEDEATRHSDFVRELIDSVPGLVFAKDQHGRFIFANKSVADIYGVTTDAMVGKTDADFNPHLAETDAYLEADRHVLASGETVQIEEPLTDQDGIQRWLLTVKQAVSSPYAEGKVLLGISTDISDRKAFENQLKERSRELEDLYNRAPCGYHSLDACGRYIRVNDTELSWLGRTREEVIGHACLADFLTPESRELFESVFPVFMQTGSIRNVEYEVVRSNGETFWVSLTADAVYDKNGKYIESRTTMFDITERRKAEHEARVARLEAERANDAKSEFLSRMSHELRTPLNAVLGHAQLLQLRGGDDRTMDSADQIVRAGSHLLELINEVLDLAKIEARRLTVSLEPVMVEDVVRQAIDLVSNIAQQRNISISTNLEPCGQTTAMADRQRAVQILINLITNAIKYNRPGGKIDIQCDCQNDGIKLAVRDEGRGIAETDRPRLFQPFERLGDETTEGTGLGLALSRSLAEAMGGKLELERSGEDGSTFALHLQPTPEDQTLAKRLQEVRSSEQTLSNNGQAIKLLYVEDNLANLQLVEAILEERGDTELISAMQGRLGLELAKSHIPNIILLDIHLPDMNGREVLKELRLDPATAAIPVVVISADATSRQIRGALDSGADGYLAKPIEVSRFLRLLTDWQERSWNRV